MTYKVKMKIFVLNDFEKICKKLEKNKKKVLRNQNRYVYAKFEVKKFVGKDADKLMLLKSEAQGESFSDYISIVVSFTALVISDISAMISAQSNSVFSITGCIIRKIASEDYNIIGLIEQGNDILSTIASWSITVIFLFTCAIYIKLQYVFSWRKYILTAVEELEKQFK